MRLSQVHCCRHLLACGEDEGAQKRIRGGGGGGEGRGKREGIRRENKKGAEMALTQLCQNNFETTLSIENSARLIGTIFPTIRIIRTAMTLINSTLHWKTILRHLLLCYYPITGHNFIIFHCLRILRYLL